LSEALTSGQLLQRHTEGRVRGGREGEREREVTEERGVGRWGQRAAVSASQPPWGRFQWYIG